MREWSGRCERLVELQRSLSRHDVVFVAYGSAVYAIKELSEGLSTSTTCS